MNAIKLAAEERDQLGKQANVKYRNEGKVPCVMYGGDQVRHFMINDTDLKSLVYTPEFNTVEIELGGQVFKTVLKDVQFHPVTEIVEHLDFQELVEGRKVKVSVPVTLFGDAEGVKEGGSLVTVIRKLQIKATPENLVSELRGDISELNLSQSICVRDMIIPEGVEVMQDPASPVGYIEVPRSLKSLETAAAKAAGIEEGGEEEVAAEEVTEETAAEE